MLAKRPFHQISRRIDLSVAYSYPSCAAWPVQLTWTLGLCTFAVSGSGSNSASSGEAFPDHLQETLSFQSILCTLYSAHHQKGSRLPVCAVPPPVDCRGRLGPCCCCLPRKSETGLSEHSDEFEMKWMNRYNSWMVPEVCGRLSHWVSSL